MRLFGEADWRACSTGNQGLLHADGESGLGDAECHKMAGENPQCEHVPEWDDYTVLPEFEAALGNIWPLFGQIAAVAHAYISLNLCDAAEQKKTRDDLASVFDNLAKMGLDECGKWMRYGADCRGLVP
jgi:hypothetical protein